MNRIEQNARGLTDWNTSRQKADKRLTAGGIEFWSLSDEDMFSARRHWMRNQENGTGLSTLSPLAGIMNENIVIAEQKKRDRMMSPSRRWKMIQESIARAEQQLPVRRNTPAACKANERKLLGQQASGT